MSSVRTIAIASVLFLRLAIAAQAPPAPFPTGTGTQLGSQIEALLNDPKASHAHWGIAVTSLDGTPIYGKDEGKFFRPASNAKLFTTATAMALLGPDRTFLTQVLGNFDPATGVVDGDLTLLGGGDANFASPDLPYAPPGRPVKFIADPVSLGDLRVLAYDLVKKGVKRITGGVVGDDSLFPWEPYPIAWGTDDPVWGYGAPVSALTISDNQLKLTVRPGKLNSDSGVYTPATVLLEQNGATYYTLNADVKTEPPDALAGVEIERLPGSRVLRVYGSIAANANPDVEHVAIEDPAEYAAMAFRAMLVQRGIAVGPNATAHHRALTERSGSFAPPEKQLTAETGFILSMPHDGPSSCLIPAPAGPIASHLSAPVGEDVIFTMKTSQNLHAEVLLHQLGHRLPCGNGSTVEGARVVRAWLLQAGLSADDFVFYDGSGLSTHDLVTPRAVVQLLAYAAKQPWFAQWKKALPIAGEDGTLTSRFPDAPLRDHLFAKTGTLGETRALSGYVDGASGKQVIFSVIVDNHSPATSEDRAVMDKIVAAIAANN